MKISRNRIIINTIFRLVLDTKVYSSTINNENGELVVLLNNSNKLKLLTQEIPGVVIGRNTATNIKKNGITKDIYKQVYNNRDIFLENLQTIAEKNMEEVDAESLVGSLKALLLGILGNNNEENSYIDISDVVRAISERLENDETVEINDFNAKKFISFLGREEELQRIDDCLKESKYVYISGKNGYGKNQLVKQYLALHSDSFSPVIYTKYKNSIEDSVLGYIKLPEEENDGDKKAIREKKLRYLEHIGWNTIIVIDDLCGNCENRDSVLEKFKAKFIIISPCCSSEIKSDYHITVEPLPDEDLMNIFISGIDDKTKEASIRQNKAYILDCLYHNTLLVKLASAWYNAHPCCINEFLGILPGLMLSQSNEKFNTPVHNATRTMTINSYIDEMINLKDIIDSKDNYCLKPCLYFFAVMLPRRKGISESLLFRWFSTEEYKEAIEILLSYRFIEYCINDRNEKEYYIEGIVAESFIRKCRTHSNSLIGFYEYSDIIENIGKDLETSTSGCDRKTADILVHISGVEQSKSEIWQKTVSTIIEFLGDNNYKEHAFIVYSNAPKKEGLSEKAYAYIMDYATTYAADFSPLFASEEIQTYFKGINKEFMLRYITASFPQFEKAYKRKYGKIKKSISCDIAFLNKLISISKSHISENNLHRLSETLPPIARIILSYKPVGKGADNSRPESLDYSEFLSFLGGELCSDSLKKAYKSDSNSESFSDDSTLLSALKEIWRGAGYVTFNYFIYTGGYSVQQLNMARSFYLNYCTDCNISTKLEWLNMLLDISIGANAGNGINSICNLHYEIMDSLSSGAEHNFDVILNAPREAFSYYNGVIYEYYYKAYLYIVQATGNTDAYTTYNMLCNGYSDCLACLENNFYLNETENATLKYSLCFRLFEKYSEIICKFLAYSGTINLELEIALNKLAVQINTCKRHTELIKENNVIVQKGICLKTISSIKEIIAALNNQVLASINSLDKYISDFAAGN